MLAMNAGPMNGRNCLKRHFRPTPPKTRAACAVTFVSPLLLPRFIHYRAAALVSGERVPVQSDRLRERIPRQYLRGIKPSPMIASWLAINPIRGPNARSMKP